MNAASAVDYVFTIMAATYGAAWDRSLGIAPMADVKTVWGDSLDDFCANDDSKRAILWGLKNLPDTVPNARQFRTLCRQAPAREVPQLDAPKADPQRVATELAKLAPLRAGVASASASDSKAWARAIVRRIADGARVSPGVATMARDALGLTAREA